MLLYTEDNHFRDATELHHFHFVFDSDHGDHFLNQVVFLFHCLFAVPP